MELLTRKAEQHQVSKEEADRSEWPDNENDPPRNEFALLCSLELETPIP